MSDKTVQCLMVRKVVNGFRVTEGYEPGSVPEVREWVASCPAELGELVETLMGGEPPKEKG